MATSVAFFLPVKKAALGDLLNVNHPEIPESWNCRYGDSHNGTISIRYTMIPSLMREPK